ncbi:MAG: glutamine synthetase family protein [Gammaproteobacteria bacterium]|nr:glutamine synthetase family protein [Gammaproteobacteria bacterium]
MNRDEMTKIADLKELEAFLVAYPGTQHLDAIFADLCGIFRGKRYPRSDFDKLFKSGLPIPYTVYWLDVTGANSDPCGRGFSDGDPDGVAVPISGTLATVPWSDTPRAQVLMNLREADGSPSMVDPRNVAAVVVERFAELGLRPVLAFELEFYLLDKERNADGRPQPPISPMTGRREDSTQVYGIDELDSFDSFFCEVEQANKIQNIPATVATAEFAPGQYEINLRHVDDPLMAADHCALQRQVVKRVARRQGMDATFMSKPFLDETGNGMHIHLSLVDANGNNVLDDGSETGSANLRHAIGGMQALMAECMGIFAPNVNAYRRFGPNQYVPVNGSWALNNRSAAFRIPAGDSRDRRIEHRVAGAEANPYLVLACILAAAHHGIVNKIDPGPPSDGNAGAAVSPDLPLSWQAAIDRLREAPLLKSYIDSEYLAIYCATKQNEMEKFCSRISPLEYDWYL